MMLGRERICLGWLDSEREVAVLLGGWNWGRKEMMTNTFFGNFLLFLELEWWWCYTSDFVGYCWLEHWFLTVLFRLFDDCWYCWRLFELSLELVSDSCGYGDWRLMALFLVVLLLLLLVLQFEKMFCRFCYCECDIVTSFVAFLNWVLQFFWSILWVGLQFGRLV